MTNTTRVHITLEKSYSDMVDELIDVFGATKPQVISNIVQHFFNDPKNDSLLSKLKERKRKINPPEPNIIDERITKYLSRSNNIPFDVFVNHLNLDTEFVIDNLDKWGRKYKFLFLNNKIVKED